MPKSKIPLYIGELAFYVVLPSALALARMSFFIFERQFDIPESKMRSANETDQQDRRRRTPFTLVKKPSLKSRPIEAVLVAIIGNDDTLRLTREDVLRRAGYSVLSVDTMEALTTGVTPVSLAILCESMNTEAAKLIALRLRVADPLSRILRIPAMDFDIEEYRFFKEIYEPGKRSGMEFLREVERMLSGPSPD